MRATKNYLGNVASIIVHAHEGIANDSEDPYTYLHQPEVWDDVRRYYEERLIVLPDDDWTRSRYARWAFRAGHFDVAVSQFNRLGTRADMDAFGGYAEYDAMRRNAERSATQPAE